MKTAPAFCPECGEDKLYYFPYYVNQGPAQDGRLVMHDVACDFVLGCEYCSHTVHVLKADDVAVLLTENNKNFI